MPLHTIEAAVHHETKAWNRKSVEDLLRLFHKNFVWVWPKDNSSIDPVEWESPLGKFDRKTWRVVYQDLFDNHELVLNERKIIKIVEEPNKKSGFAIVDVNTVWEHKTTKNRMCWQGRTCKTYIRTLFGYQLISHYGVIKH